MVFIVSQCSHKIIRILARAISHPSLSMVSADNEDVSLLAASRNGMLRHTTYSRYVCTVTQGSRQLALIVLKRHI